MWNGCGVYWVWSVLVVMLEKRWGINYMLINLGKVAWYKQQAESGLIVSVLHFVYVDLYANIPALYGRLGFSVSVTTSLLFDCYSISATTSIFHFPEQCGDPSVYLFHHDRTLMAWPPIWYYLIALYMFIWVVTGQGPHQGHWALCCLWMRVMFITSIRVNLYIRPCIFVCAFLLRDVLSYRGTFT